MAKKPLCPDRKRMQRFLKFANTRRVDVRQWLETTPRGDWLLMLIGEMALHTAFDSRVAMRVLNECAEIVCEGAVDQVREHTLPVVAALHAKQALDEADIRKALNTVLGASRRGIALPSSTLAVQLAEKIRSIVTWDDVSPFLDEDENGRVIMKDE